MDHQKLIRKFGLACGSLFISLLLSCSSNKVEPLIIEVSTSGCYSTCPIVDVKFEKGEVYYNFINYNEKVGIYKYALTDTEISKIDSLLYSIDFDNIKEEYISHRNDMQIYNTKIIHKGFEKKIYFYEDEAPKPYENLIQYLIGLGSQEVKRIDTVIEYATRKKVGVINMPIPPMPKDILN